MQENEVIINSGEREFTENGVLYTIITGLILGIKVECCGNKVRL